VVLDFEPKSAATSTKAMDEVLGVVEDKGYEVEWILDTHPHADHFMASASLKEKLGVPNAIGEKVREIEGL
jgi:glyoxylase-like metal-dependent hydrolase (beta-lactamase superfamily II)